MSNHKQPAKPALGEFFKIHALLKLDLLEDTKVCAKFVDGVSKVIDSSFFARRKAQSRRGSLLAMMQKSVILVVEYTCME